MRRISEGSRPLGPPAHWASMLGALFLSACAMVALVAWLGANPGT